MIARTPIIIRLNPKDSKRRRDAFPLHASEDGAERALDVIDTLSPEHRPAALRILREAIDQRIGVRSAGAKHQAAEAVFKTGRAA